MPLEGRGTSYSRSRALVEWTLLRAYRRGWPAGVAHALGLQGRVNVVRHEVVPPRWEEGSRPLRIAFASDLHAGPTTHPAQLDAAAAALAAAKPDVLLLGGDYVFLTSRDVEAVAERMGAIPAPFGRFGVLGNHDLWSDDRRIGRALERAGVHVLVNEVAHLVSPFEHVSICGVDDPWTGARDTRGAFVEARDYRILLAHAPEALLTIGDARFDLGLCGHTHGGHIALPGGLPIVAPGPLSRRYAHGRYDLAGGRTLIVSRGVGATEVPLRWNADPDVLVVDVVRRTNGGGRSAR